MKITNSVKSQFKLIEVKKKYYLIDVDSNFGVFFLPVLVWFFPLKAFKIDKELFNRLKESKPKKNNFIVLTTIGLVIGKILSESTKSFFGNINYNRVEKVIGLFIIAILILLVRLLMSYRNRKAFLKKYSIPKEKITIKFDKESVKPHFVKQQYIRLILFYCLALVFMYIYLNFSVDLILVIVLGLIIFIFLNRNEDAPYEGEVVVKKEQFRKFDTSK